jgi:hypothetical protein
MRWRPKPEEEWPRDHWEEIVRTMVERIDLEQLCDVIESVVTKMREDEVIAAQGPRARQSCKAEPTVGRSLA